MQPVKILIVDDEETIRVLVKETIQRHTNYTAILACDGVEALEIVKKEPVNLVITDLTMPKMDGWTLLKEIKEFNPHIPVIVLTCHSTIENAVELLRKGAIDYVTKPFQTSEFVSRINKVIETLQLKQEIRELRMQMSEADMGNVRPAIIGNSIPIEKLLKKIRPVARSDVAVIFYGESGTGKELFARAIHDLSGRADKPFVTVNCGALPDTLLENELFGHEKGAYTDASFDQEGMVSEADGGTLFLDEIGDTSLNVQVKLLRFLQEKEYKPLGAKAVRKANVRIVAATNRDLPLEVKNGTFREDLFYRLNIFPLDIPPLRERKEDIPILIKHFLKKYSHLHDGLIKSVSPIAVQQLVHYNWPGNVRELENKIQQLIIMSTTNVITEDSLELSSVQTDSPSMNMVLDENLSFKDAKSRVVEEFERTFLCRLLEKHNGNITRAAKDAKKNRRAFWQLMKKYCIDAGDFSSDGSSVHTQF